jgi:hypothetical protein
MSRYNGRTDSLLALGSLNKLRDSLVITRWADNLSLLIDSRFSSDALTRSADSMRRFRVPEPTILHRTESLLRKKALLLAEVKENQVALQAKVNSRFVNWSESVRRRLNLDSARVGVPNFGVTSSRPFVPGTNLPGISGQGMPEIPSVPSLEIDDFSSLGVSPELSAAGGDLVIPTVSHLADLRKAVPSLHDPLGDAGKQIEVAKELIASPADIAEKAASNVQGVNDAAQRLNEAEQMKQRIETAEQLKDPEEFKRQAVDHLAGKEAELSGAMVQMARYKKKYSSIASLSEIKKNDWLPKNGLKGKPFKERFRPGLNLGVRSNPDTVLLDFYPNAAYRITGRFEAGVAAIYRLRVSTTPFGFDQRDPVWGLATFVVVKTFKSVFLRMEADGTSHPKQGTSEQRAYRDWRWNFYVGLQTNFKLSKRLTGNVQMLYNGNSNLKDGFPEKLSARVGVQYKVAK